MHMMSLFNLINILFATSMNFPKTKFLIKNEENHDILNKEFPLLLSDFILTNIKTNFVAYHGLRDIPDNANNDQNTSSRVEIKHTYKCLHCSRNLVDDINFNKYSIVCCQFDSDIHYYHLKCIIDLTVSHYNIMCIDIYTGIYTDERHSFKPHYRNYVPVHMWNIILMYAMGDECAKRLFDNPSFAITLDRREYITFLYKFLDENNNWEILVSYKHWLLNHRYSLYRSIFLREFRFKHENDLYKKLSYSDMIYIIENKRYHYLICDNFIKNITTGFLNVLIAYDNFCFNRLIKNIIKNKSIGIVKLYTKYAYIIRHTIAKKILDSFNEFCFEHAMLLIKCRSVEGIVSLCHIFDNIVYLDKSKMKHILKKYLKNYIDHRGAANILLFAIRNSSMSYSKICDIIKNMSFFEAEAKSKLNDLYERKSVEMFIKEYIKSNIYVKKNEDIKKMFIDNAINALLAKKLYYIHFYPFFKLQDHINTIENQANMLCKNSKPADKAADMLAFYIKKQKFTCAALYIESYASKYIESYVDVCLNSKLPNNPLPFTALFMRIIRKNITNITKVHELYKKVLLYYADIKCNLSNTYFRKVFLKNISSILNRFFNADLIRREIEGLYISNDYIYDPDIFPCHYIRRYFYENDDIINYIELISRLLNERQYSLVFTYLHNSCFLTSRINTKHEFRYCLTFSKFMYIYIDDGIQTIFKKYEYADLYYNESIIPI